MLTVRYSHYKTSLLTIFGQEGNSASEIHAFNSGLAADESLRLCLAWHLSRFGTTETKRYLPLEDSL